MEPEEEMDVDDEVETNPVSKANPEQSTSVSSSSKGKKRKDTQSMEKSSNKKAKKTGGKKVSSTLKQLIEELLTDIPDGGRSLKK